MDCRAGKGSAPNRLPKARSTGLGDASAGTAGAATDSVMGCNGTVRLTIKARPRSYTAAMPTARDPLYQRHRFPPEVISHAVWLYLWTVPAMQGLLRQSGNARLQLSIRSLTQRRC